MISTTQTTQPYAFTPGAPPATFAIPFAYQQTSEIKATLSQSGLADVVLTQGVDYSVSAAPASSGTLTVMGPNWAGAYAAYGNVVVFRQTALINSMSIINGGDIDAAVLEMELDELTQMIQEASAATNILGKPLLFPLTDPAGISQYLPAVASRALNALTFDAAGNPVATSPSAASINAAWQTELAQGSSLPFLRALVISSSQTLVVNTRNRVSGVGIVLTLPTSAAAGDRIEIVNDDWCILAQSDAQHGISWQNRYFTTKGAAVTPPSATAARFIILPPKTSLSIVYKGAGYSRLETPTVLGAQTAAGGIIRKAVWSPDSRYIATFSDGPNLEIYKRTFGADTFTKLSALTAPNGNGAQGSMSWSSDGTYFAIGTATTPFIEVYRMTGVDTWTKVSALPAATASVTGLAFSPDGNYLAATMGTTPFVEIYKRTAGTDTFVKQAAMTAATGALKDCAWSPDGALLAVVGGTTPYVEVYRRTGSNAFTKLGALTAALGPLNVALWTPEGNLAVNGPTGGALGAEFYKRTPGTDTFLKLASAFDNIGGTGADGMAMSPGGDTFFIHRDSGTTPPAFFRRYPAATGVDWFGKLADPPAAAIVRPARSSFSPDGVYIALTGSVSPFIQIYKAMEDITKAWIVENLVTAFPTVPDAIFR